MDGIAAYYLRNFFGKEAETLIMLTKVSILHDLYFNLQAFVDMDSFIRYIGFLDPTF